MTTFCGVDLHARQQTVSYRDAAGEVRLAELDPEREAVLQEWLFKCHLLLRLSQAFPSGFFMKRNSPAFKWRHFEPSVSLLCVRWYCRYHLSYRDLEEMMRERGPSADHTTLWE